jgi:hypothetical protein
MKKIIFATVLVALSLASFAGGKNENKKLLADLQTALKASTQVHYSNKNGFNNATFNFNGRAVSAFYDENDNGLIGFSIKTPVTELPQQIADAIAKKYSDWKIVDAILFIDSHASFNYFAQVQKGKVNLAIKIVNGKACIYDRVPIN